MPRKASIHEFVPVERPVEQPITKFGGQPNWIENPEWPLSATLGKPMRFLCQVRLDGELFPGRDGTMLYLFMTEDGEDYVDGTWEADGGENAVILQPQGLNTESVAEHATGPTLQQYVSVPGHERLQPVDVELAVSLRLSDDPEPLSAAERYSLDDERFAELHQTLEGNKIGGVPSFVQDDEYPSPEDGWQLALQLDSTRVPFYVNFGDAGVGYLFLHRDGRSAKFLWQCH